MGRGPPPVGPLTGERGPGPDKSEVLSPMGEHRVVVLFSGAGAPGMNAVLRAIVRLGLNRHRTNVLGARDGFDGLVRTASRLESGHVTGIALMSEIDAHGGLSGLLRADQGLIRLDHGSVSGLLGRGGIILGAGRCPEFHAPDVRRRVIGLLEYLNVHAVIVCGGDGSMTGAACLAAESDLRVIGIPASINSVVPMTDMALGTDTALNILAYSVGQLAEATNGHYRVTVIEGMGFPGGELARMAALATGAEIVVTPEQGPLTEAKMAAIAGRLEQAMVASRRNAVVLMANSVALDPPDLHGARPASRLTSYLESHFHRAGSPFPGLETGTCVLGPLQRGAAPSAADRILANRFAEAAWKAVTSRNERSGVLGLHAGLHAVARLRGRR